MTFREFVDNCNKLIAERPEIGEYQAIAASDDEGNYFTPVHYTPTIGNLDQYGGFETEGDESENKPNAVCELTEVPMRTHKEIIEELHKTVGDNPWADHPRFTHEDWRTAVHFEETNLGYRDWLYNQLMEEDDADHA